MHKQTASQPSSQADRKRQANMQERKTNMHPNRHANNGTDACTDACTQTDRQTIKRRGHKANREAWQLPIPALRTQNTKTFSIPQCYLFDLFSEPAALTTSWPRLRWLCMPGSPEFFALHAFALASCSYSNVFQDSHGKLRSA